MFHEVIVRVTAMNAEGVEKQKTERYFTQGKLVLAESESAVMEYLIPYSSNTDVICIKQSKVKEFANNRTGDEQDIYIITLEDTFVNMDTGEKSSTKYDIGLFAKSVPDATKKAEEYCKQGLTDLSIVSIKKTKWIDIL
jgi:peroxiredoxin